MRTMRRKTCAYMCPMVQAAWTAIRRPETPGIDVGIRASLDFRLGLTPARPRHVDACTPGLRQTDRDYLLHRPRAVLAGANMFDFLSNEFSGLRHRCLSLAPCPLSASECLWFRHDDHPPFSISAGRLHVTSRRPELGKPFSRRAVRPSTGNHNDHLRR